MSKGGAKAGFLYSETKGILDMAVQRKKTRGVKTKSGKRVKKPSVWKGKARTARVKRPVRRIVGRNTPPRGARASRGGVAPHNAPDRTLHSCRSCLAFPHRRLFHPFSRFCLDTPCFLSLYCHIQNAFRLTIQKTSFRATFAHTPALSALRRFCNTADSARRSLAALSSPAASASRSFVRAARSACRRSRVSSSRRSM